MALKVHRVVVVGCPRCILIGDLDKIGVGKSCFCNRFVRPDSFKLQHPSRLSEELWRDSPAYNGDHFLYWGAATKRHGDGTKTRFQVVEQTEFFDIEDGELFSHRSEDEYIRRASAAHFISRGKVAYKVHEEEEYAIPSSLKSNPNRSRSVQLFPNNEFSEGKGVSGFICLFDPTLEGKNIKIQFDFLTHLINEILKTKRKVVVACTKCDEVNEARIQFGANLVASIRSKKPIPFIQVSAKEGINIDEAFNYIVGQYNVKKKPMGHKGGKSSPVMLGLPYTELVKSRGKDESFARATLNRIIREKVTFFNAEWSTTWPYLQLDPKCLEAANVLGLHEAKKIFCQRLMELKVAEVKGRSKCGKLREKRHEEKTRNCQSEILEAFSTHPDLINESAYDFVYTPSVPSFDTISSSSPLSPGSPRHSSSLNSFQQSPTGLHSDSPVPQQMGMSPPPIITTPPSEPVPLVCPEPGFIAQYRSTVFSPSKTCLAVNSFASQQFNKSTELLATLPRVNVGIQRHSSLRYKNRTLPPLPTSRRSDTVNEFPLSLAKSQPHLEDTDDDDDDEMNSNDGEEDASLPRPSRIQRRLSNSMECLHSSSSSFDKSIEASPYISPVDVQAVLAASNKDKKPSSLATSSMRVPPQKRDYPSLPEGFLTLGRNHQYSKNYALSNPRLSDGSVCMLTNKPRSSSSPPLPSSHLQVSILDNTTDYQAKKSLEDETTTSLDIRDSWLRGRNACILDEGDDSTEDNVSTISGPFTELEEPDCLPPLMSEIKKSHESLSKMPSNFVIPSNTPTTTASDSSLADKVSESELDHVDGIYASIPSTIDDEYLTMKPGVSLDDLLNTPTKGVNNTPLPSAKSVIKRLQMFTHSKTDGEILSIRRSESPLTPKASPSRVKKTSGASIQSVPVSRRSIDSMESKMLNRGGHRSTMFNRRPLPQSPTKIRKSSSISGQGQVQVRRKTSVNDSNIYETIDGEQAADWLKQLKGVKPRMVSIEDEEVSNDRHNLDRIMEHFLSHPVVQEQWKASVRTVYPEFAFPDTKTIPPFVINPAYFVYRSRSQSVERIMEEEEETPVDTKKAGLIEKPFEKLNDSQGNSPTEDVNEPSTNVKVSEATGVEEPQRSKISKKDSFTDQVLARLNQHLLGHQDSSSEESEDEDDETYSETSSSECEGQYDVENAQNEFMNGQRRKISLTSIREQFSRHSEIDEKLILLDSSPDRNLQQNKKAAILNGISNLNSFDIDSASSLWMPPNTHDNHITKVFLNDDEDDESGTGSSSPTVLGDPPTGPPPIVSSVIHPVHVKNSNNHLTVCQFNSMDSGISANGNISTEDHV